MLTEMAEHLELRQTDCDRCRCVDAHLEQSDDELLCALCKWEKEHDASA